MPTLIAVKAHTYNNKTIEAGEEFEADEPYATTLVSLGRATLKDKKSTKTQPTTTASARQADDKDEDDKKQASGTAHPTAKPGSAGAAYATRRMKAEDDKK